MNRILTDMHLMLRRPPRQQFGALCYRRKKKQQTVEVLLVTSRDTGRWVIPKGWPMAGKKAHTVAEREAYEEAGAKGKVSPEPFGFYHYPKGLEGGLKVACKVQVHLLEVKDTAKDFPEKASRRVEWVSCEEAAARVQEPELKTLFHRFSRMMADGGPAELKAAGS